MNLKNIFHNPVFRFFLLVGLLVGLWFAGKAAHIDISGVRSWLAQYPLWLSGLLFIVLYVGITSLLWVGTIDFFRISGVFLFGAYVSAVLVYIAEICNASILFMISRKLGREYVQQKFGLKEKDLAYAKNNAGFWWAFALRTNLLVPFRFMDLGYGLTKLPLRKYFWAVVFGSPVRILLLQIVIEGLGETFFQQNMTPLEMLTAAQNYLLANRDVFFFCLGYCLMVIILTIVAIVFSAAGRKKAPATSPA